MWTTEWHLQLHTVPLFFLKQGTLRAGKEGCMRGARSLFFSGSVVHFILLFCSRTRAALWACKNAAERYTKWCTVRPRLFCGRFFPFLYLLHCRGSRLLNYMKGLSSTTKNSSGPVFTKCKTFSPAKHPYKHCKPLKIFMDKPINSSFCILNNKLQRLEKINKIVLANKQVRDRIWHCWCGVITLHFMANSFVRAPHHYVHFKPMLAQPF